MHMKTWAAPYWSNSSTQYFGLAPIDLPRLMLVLVVTCREGRQFWETTGNFQIFLLSHCLWDNLWVTHPLLSEQYDPSVKQHLLLSANPFAPTKKFSISVGQHSALHSKTLSQHYESVLPRRVNSILPASVKKIREKMKLSISIGTRPLEQKCACKHW